MQTLDAASEDQLEKQQEAADVPDPEQMEVSSQEQTKPEREEITVSRTSPLCTPSTTLSNTVS